MQFYSGPPVHLLSGVNTFLSPELVEVILHGRQPVELTATRLTELDLPLNWTDQRSLLAS